MALDRQVLVNKVRWVDVVSLDTAHLCRRQEHILRPFALEKRRHSMLVGQVKFAMRARHQVVVALAPQLAHQCRADQPPMPRDVDFAIVLHEERSHS
ncbi:hypothetical protein D3C72_1986800 [compost metagenome]